MPNFICEVIAGQTQQRYTPEDIDAAVTDAMTWHALLTMERPLPVSREVERLGIGAAIVVYLSFRAPLTWDHAIAMMGYAYCLGYQRATEDLEE